MPSSFISLAAAAGRWTLAVAGPHVIWQVCLGCLPLRPANVAGLVLQTLLGVSLALGAANGWQACVLTAVAVNVRGAVPPLVYFATVVGLLAGLCLRALRLRALRSQRLCADLSVPGQVAAPEENQLSTLAQRVADFIDLVPAAWARFSVWLWAVLAEATRPGAAADRSQDDVGAGFAVSFRTLLSGPRLAPIRSRFETAAGVLRQAVGHALAGEWCRGHAVGRALPCLIVLLAGTAFGLWYSAVQLNAVSPKLAGVYPGSFRALTVVQCAVTVLAPFLATVALLARAQGATLEGGLRLGLALSYMPLTLVHLGWGITSCALLALASNVVLIAAWTVKSWARLSGFGAHLLALGVILAANYTLNDGISPRSQDQALTRVSFNFRNLTCACLHRAFLWSKQSSMTDDDYSFWAALRDSPVSLRSYLLQTLAFVEDVPSLDPAEFARLLALVIFVLIVAGSFGCYLYMRVGLRLRFSVSTLAGLFFMLGNYQFCASYLYDGPILVTCFAVLPYALLLQKLAFRRGSVVLAAWSGAVFASQFFIFASHPEGVMLSTLVYAVIVGWNTLRGEADDCSFARRLCLTIVSSSAFALLSTGYLVPLAYGIVTGNLTVVGHANANSYAPAVAYTFTIVDWPCAPGSAPTGGYEYCLRQVVLVIACFIFEGVKAVRSRHVAPALAAFGLLAVVALAPVIPGVIGAYAIAAKAFGLNIHFALPRLGIVLDMASIFIVAVGLNSFGDALRTDAGRRLALRGNGWKGVVGAAGSGSVVVGIFLGALPLHPIKSRHEVENPRGSPYYLTLRACLSNLPGLVADRANLRFLRDRLARFEEDTRSDEPRAVRALSLYEVALKRACPGASRAGDLSEGQVAPAVRSVAGIVDDYYLGDPDRVHPFVFDEGPPRHVMKHNLASLFDALPDRFTRIYGVTDDERWLGIAPGWLVHNGCTDLNASVLMGPPLLQALYVMPGVEPRGTTADDGHGGVRYLDEPISWSLPMETIMSPMSRHLLAIGGVDVYVLRTKNLARISSTDLVEIASPEPDATIRGYTMLRDPHSYGIAYFAASVRDVDPEAARVAEEALRDHMRGRISGAQYHASVDPLRDRLLELTTLHSVLRERAHSQTVDDAGFSSGTVRVLGLAGPRIVTEAVASGRGLLVLNVAALPGWRAFVDDRPVSIERVNYAFMAVEVPGGTHTVWFVYMPTCGVVAWFVTLATAVGLLLFSCNPDRSSSSLS